jgi:hypothetical protein
MVVHAKHDSLVEGHHHFARLASHAAGEAGLISKSEATKSSKLHRAAGFAKHNVSGKPTRLVCAAAIGVEGLAVGSSVVPEGRDVAHGLGDAACSSLGSAMSASGVFAMYVGSAVQLADLTRLLGLAPGPVPVSVITASSGQSPPSSSCEEAASVAAVGDGCKNKKAVQAAGGVEGQRSTTSAYWKACSQAAMLRAACRLRGALRMAEVSSVNKAAVEHRSPPFACGPVEVAAAAAPVQNNVEGEDTTKVKDAAAEEAKVALEAAAEMGAARAVAAISGLAGELGAICVDWGLSWQSLSASARRHDGKYRLLAKVDAVFCRRQSRLQSPKVEFATILHEALREVFGVIGVGQTSKEDMGKKLTELATALWVAATKGGGEVVD